ncbi:hypothetical protein OH491_12060 [Termitidicoccus mucosus]|uniref:Heparinase II N-terminal domain-containing protein n=1 Tax=Termitidicoccus mucosus TaxID=1184151 RepID=A0A178IFT5_9BACT|nr:hypothetical protein AW736_15325 [Opitutaceae bacterium TSB47]
MNKNLRYLPRALFLLPVLAAIAASAQPLWQGDPGKGAAELEAQWQTLTRPDAVVGIRGVLRFAVEAAALDWHPGRVEHALEFARGMQDLDPASPTHGNFRWYSNQPRPVDLNAAEFAAQLLGVLHAQSRDRLTPAARDRLRELMTDAIEGMKLHQVKLPYTNIWLKKTWCLIALGEALGRPDVADDGYARLAEWLRFTAANGICEFNAVTYYGTDLDSLNLIAKYAARPEGRALALKAARYLWTAAAANWFAAGDRLGGANARSYDYLFGHGYFECFTWTAGWLRARPDIENAGWIGSNHDNLVAFRNAAHLPAPREWTEPVRAQIPRTVVQRWGEAPARTAVHWVGRHAGLGTSGEAYSREDRALVIDLGDSPAIPQLTLFMDGRGDPFGTKKVKGADAHAKALHLVPFIASVQRGPEALQLLSLEPLGPAARFKPKPGELSCLLTHLTIPREAEVWAGDARLKPGTPAKPAVIPPGAPLFARIGDAAAAIRILYSDTTDGDRPAEIRFIDDGRAAKARRLTLVHDTAEPKGRATVVAWLRVAEGLDDAGFAAFRQTFASAAAGVKKEGSVIKATAAGLAAPLRIEADVEKQERLLLEGGEPRPALLTVNGREIGFELLGEFLTRP